MEIEKEVRYKVDKDMIKKVKEISKLISEKQKQLDIVLGFYGFESLKKSNFICRVRKKENRTSMEIKKRIKNGNFEEYNINIDEVSTGIDFFRALGMKPYLYIKKTRQEMEYKGLKIFIDNVEMLGDYIEIEFQNIYDYKKILNEFLKLAGIKSNTEPLYGDIFKNKILADSKFKELFNKKIEEYIKNI